MRAIGFVVFPSYQVMSFAVVSVFEFANIVSDKTAYSVHMLSETGGSVRTSVGIQVATERFGKRALDTLIVGGSTTVEPVSAGVLAFVRKSITRYRRVASACTGAFVLAEAGLLDGRRATTHWLYARQLQESYPAICVDADRIFIVDGPVWTSAGMTSGIDLALAMVERDLGVDIARDVAKKLVVFHRRAGGQSQFSTLLELEPKTDRIQGTLLYARENLNTDLSVTRLAAIAHLSPRQFSRAFTAETGQSPAKAVEQMRVEAARLLIEESSLSMDAIADDTGFADPDRMRRAFLRRFGRPPQALRRNARAELPG